MPLVKSRVCVIKFHVGPRVEHLRSSTVQLVVKIKLVNLLPNSKVRLFRWHMFRNYQKLFNKIRNSCAYAALQKNQLGLAYFLF